MKLYWCKLMEDFDFITYNSDCEDIIICEYK